MSISIDMKKKKQLEQQKKAQERARAKQLAKFNDPKEKAKKLAKAKASQEKQRQKQIDKMNDPKERAKQEKKRAESQRKRIEKEKTKPVVKKTTAKPKSKGLLGRTPTAQEKGIMNKIGSLSCICCFNKDRDNPVISLHHLDGRVKENCHAWVLPLCAYHHDTALDKESLAKYPDMIPIHAKGTLGGKAQWRLLHGNEWDLLKQCYELLGISFDFLNSK